MPQAKRPSPRPPTPAFVPPYPPSWVDRFTDWVDRRPGPTWIWYVLGAIALAGIEVLVQWREGTYRDGFVATHLFVLSSPVLYLAIIHYLQKVASGGVDRFRGATRGSEHDVADARYRLTTLPARPTLIAGLALAIPTAVAGLSPASMANVRMAQTIVSQIAAAPYLLLQAWTFAALFYFLVHELRTVRRLLAQVSTADLYHPDPLYAFSPLTARTAAVVFLLTFAWTSSNASDVTSLVVGTPIVALGAALFVWPLWGAHLLLVSEKRRALAENGSRLKSAAADLHHRIDAGKLERMDDLNKAMASLEIELVALKRIPTWPWESATLRGLAAAFLLPILIWLLQYGLQRFLG